MNLWIFSFACESVPVPELGGLGRCGSDFEVDLGFGLSVTTRRRGAVVDDILDGFGDFV
jgi:hypothetical protein